MCELFSYNVDKVVKDVNNYGSLKLITNNDTIIVYSDFIKKHKNENFFRTYYELTISQKDGNFIIIFNQESSNKRKSTKTKVFKNNFKELNTLYNNGIFYGWKGLNFWGKKYRNEIEKLDKIICDLFNINDNYKPLLNKKPSNLFNYVTLFYYQQKNIKVHDNIFTHTIYGEPKLKYLKENDNKFLPSLLQEYGIKTKYFISELSNENGENINIKTLSLLCNFFGDNYHDYIKKINWQELSKIDLEISKPKITVDDNIKKDILNLLQENQKTKKITDRELILTIYDIIVLKNFLEKKRKKVPFKLKTISDLNNQKTLLFLLKKETEKGYRLTYDIPSSIKKIIEEPILINENIFTVKLLLSESDFVLESNIMKNCMNKQFINGEVNLFVIMELNNTTRINIQYDKGKKTQSYGKANSPVPNEFNDALDILNNRMMTFSDLKWKKNKEILK